MYTPQPRHWIALAWAFVSLFILTSASAEILAPPPIVQPSAIEQPVIIPAPPEVAARAYFLIDADSGYVIMQQNADERVPPASLTKLMTAYVVESEVQSGKMKYSDPVQISVKAWQTGGSKMFVREGNTVALGDLMRGIIIQSGNDACVAVAEHIAGTEDAFANIMNQHAQLLGMKNTHYMNATGLPHPDHYSSAKDLAILARAIIQQFPEQYKIYSEQYFTWNNIRQPNRNLLLWRDKSVDGLKTGHTDEAGYCQVSSAKRDGMRLIGVVLGTHSEEERARESLKLLDYGFRYYETHKLYNAGDKLQTTHVWKGAADSVDLGIADALAVTIQRGQKQQLQAVVEMDPIIKAPIEQGQTLGKLKVTLGDQVVAERPLVALQSVEEGGFFKRLWDSIVLFFKGLF